MHRRFSGEEGRRRLKATLNAHPLFSQNPDLIGELVSRLEIIELGLDDILIGLGRGERDLFVVLSGCLSVLVNGREVATCEAGSYVGEMALIDADSRRSATVLARDRTVVGRIEEPAFTELADRSPALWRNLAIDMERRLQAVG